MVTLINSTTVSIFNDAKDLCEFAAKDFSQRCIAAISDKGEFSVVLSGGNTPRQFFDILVNNYNSSIPWEHVHFFFGDERYVPADNEKSNYHMAYEHLFSKVPVNPQKIYRIQTDFQDPKDAAINYESTLKQAFHLHEASLPQFDLVYLGLGENAHTASLMPYSDLVRYYAENPNSDRRNQLVASVFDPTSNMYRITLTPTAINNAMNIIFLVTGENKATATSKVLEGIIDPLHYPAQLIQCIHEQTVWYLDKLAANKLSHRTRNKIGAI